MFLSALQEAKEGFGDRDPHVASAYNNLVGPLIDAFCPSGSQYNLLQAINKIICLIKKKDLMPSTSFFKINSNAMAAKYF